MAFDDTARLLDEIAAKAGCEYLSDLHDPFRAPEVLAAVQRVCADDHTLASWKQAADYITGEPCVAQTPQSAQVSLCGWLGRAADSAAE